MFILILLLEVRRGKAGGSSWVQVESIGFAGQTSRGSKRVMFKRVNQIASRVDLYFSNKFFFFFQLQKQINDNLFRENE